MLESKIKELKRSKDILLMTHLVLGYPSIDENRKTIDAMYRAGVELIELQIPFSEPMADGPVILKANQDSIANGTRVEACINFGKEMVTSFPHITFLFMTYYNILLSYGVRDFIEIAAKTGILGNIIPDLPPEEGEKYIHACKDFGVAPIFIFTPTNTEARLKRLNQFAKGFVYCVGRKGVTGPETNFDINLKKQIDRYKNATNLPLALGFGVSSKDDINFLKNKVDIAVIGTQILQIHRQQGPDGVQSFLAALR